MRKKQNTRRDLAASVHKIYNAGIFVNAGFILGFDSEKAGTAEDMIACIEDTSVPVCMVGLLYALPNTQLTRRLTREGRLYVGNHICKSDRHGDQCTAGLNFDTVRPRRDVLTDYVHVLERIYHPDAFFARVKHVAHHLRLPPADGVFGFNRGDFVRLFGLLWYLLRKQPRLIGRFSSVGCDCFVHNPPAFNSVMTLTALYLHLGPFAIRVIKTIKGQIAILDEGAWLPPQRVPIPATPPQQRRITSATVVRTAS